MLLCVCGHGWVRNSTEKYGGVAHGILRSMCLGNSGAHCAKPIPGQRNRTYRTYRTYGVLLEQCVPCAFKTPEYMALCMLYAHVRYTRYL